MNYPNLIAHILDVIWLLFVFTGLVRMIVRFRQRKGGSAPSHVTKAVDAEGAAWNVYMDDPTMENKKSWQAHWEEKSTLNGYLKGE